MTFTRLFTCIWNLSIVKHEEREKRRNKYSPTMRDSRHPASCLHGVCWDSWHALITASARTLLTSLPRQQTISHSCLKINYTQTEGSPPLIQRISWTASSWPRGELLQSSLRMISMKKLSSGCHISSKTRRAWPVTWRSLVFIMFSTVIEMLIKTGGCKEYCYLVSGSLTTYNSLFLSIFTSIELKRKFV